jgi:hypothetical protein
MTADTHIKSDEHSRLLKERFNKIMGLWFKELVLNEDIKATLIFGAGTPAKWGKNIISNLQIKKDNEEKIRKNDFDILYNSNFIEPVDFDLQYTEQQIKYVKENNNFPLRDYPRTPIHFAKMVCVGFELFPKGTRGKSYMTLYRDYLDNPEKLEKELKDYELTQNIDFLTLMYRRTSDPNEEISDWRKRTKERYEKIWLSSIVGADIRAKSKHKKEYESIKAEILEIKFKILNYV